MNLKNVGRTDQIVRVLLGLALLALGWSGLVGGSLALALKIIGFIPLLTGIVGWCPLYSLIKFSTHKA